MTEGEFSICHAGKAVVVTSTLLPAGTAVPPGWGVAVMEALEGVESLDFDQILAQRDGRRPSRAVIVATFLAILELTRLAALRIYQNLSEAAVPEGPIYLRRTFPPGDLTWKHLIAEET